MSAAVVFFRQRVSEHGLRRAVEVSDLEAHVITVVSATLLDGALEDLPAGLQGRASAVDPFRVPVDFMRCFERVRL